MFDSYKYGSLSFRNASMFHDPNNDAISDHSLREQFLDNFCRYRESIFTMKPKVFQPVVLHTENSKPVQNIMDSFHRVESRDSITNQVLSNANTSSNISRETILTTDAQSELDLHNRHTDREREKLDESFKMISNQVPSFSMDNTNNIIPEHVASNLEKYLHEKVMSHSAAAPKELKGCVFPNPSNIGQWLKNDRTLECEAWKGGFISEGPNAYRNVLPPWQLQRTTNVSVPTLSPPQEHQSQLSQLQSLHDTIAMNRQALHPLGRSMSGDFFNSNALKPFSLWNFNEETNSTNSMRMSQFNISSETSMANVNYFGSQLQTGLIPNTWSQGMPFSVLPTPSSINLENCKVKSAFKVVGRNNLGSLFSKTEDADCKSENTKSGDLQRCCVRGNDKKAPREKPFKCECGRMFARNEELTRHRRIHSGYKPHRCGICAKLFGRKDHLSKHLKTHLRICEKKTHVCTVMGCTQSYTRTDALTRHQFTAHGIPPKTSKWRPHKHRAQ